MFQQDMSPWMHAVVCPRLDAPVVTAAGAGALQRFLSRRHFFGAGIVFTEREKRSARTTKCTLGACFTEARVNVETCCQEPDLKEQGGPLEYLSLLQADPMVFI